MERKKPLYPKVNTRTHGVRHGHGGEWRWSRNAKAVKQDDALNGSMQSHHRHGLDYTPLFKFLLSRIGRDWDETYSEAVARIDRPDSIFWLVARSAEERTPYVRVGESTYYSGLYVDDDKRLALVDPTLTVDDMKPTCWCCTHTFNGERFTQSYDDTLGGTR
ncbi:hypothetical protein [Sinorhizobium americanum]|uniref:Uncharacterized protein n=1 Tax=Sinorhizobium americanum TaxID=194963 RepID=A0A4R2C0U8_9HYPH|nr:hypothetical protein [Sinorhizobium americanum]TCN33967.1 hypothetical protein EV184_102278 [Sinorhizobium americanum]